MGAPEDALAKLRARASPQEEEGLVLRTNWPAVTLFQTLTTQWRWSTRGAAGMGGALLRAIRVGLDYGAIESTARLAGLQVTPIIFDQLRTMETAALVELAVLQADR